jgi:hypothetical protein
MRAAYGAAGLPLLLFAAKKQQGADLCRRKASVPAITPPNNSKKSR